ncbi:hypothetical protein MKW92_029665, partial [Papaver armeniacum]
MFYLLSICIVYQSLSVALNFTYTSSPVCGLSSGAIEDKQDDENMTSENQATSDGQTQQQHLHEKKRGRPEGMNDFQTSPDKRRASTTDVLQQQTNSDF